MAGWNLARRVVLNDTSFKDNLTEKEIEGIFDTTSRNVLRTYGPLDVIPKLNAYDREQNIYKGNIVECIDGYKGIVIGSEVGDNEKYRVLLSDFAIRYYYKEDLKKTGTDVDLENIFNSIIYSATKTTRKDGANND